MTAAPEVKTGWSPGKRAIGLRRFALGITLFNVLGHAYLGFEQALIHPFAALAAAYSTELALEGLAAVLAKRRPRFAGGVGPFTDFLLSAHISGLAVAMLLYANARVAPVVFAAVTAIASKYVLRSPTSGRHVFNPSNFGITATLLLFPWVGIAPAYHFTENISGAADWLIIVAIAVAGGALNMKVTKRLPLIAAWLGGFVLQALLRSVLFDASFPAALVPMSGVAFLLFTFYMVTDPPTTPRDTRGQVLFGLSVAGTYGVLMSLHVVFGLFFALSIVCSARYSWSLIAERALSPRRDESRSAISVLPEPQRTR